MLIIFKKKTLFRRKLIFLSKTSNLPVSLNPLLKWWISWDWMRNFKWTYFYKKWNVLFTAVSVTPDNSQRYPLHLTILTTPPFLSFCIPRNFASELRKRQPNLMDFNIEKKETFSQQLQLIVYPTWILCSLSV